MGKGSALYEITMIDKNDTAKNRKDDQLSYLTGWYAAMDSTGGKIVDLFDNDISYLMANNAIWGGNGLSLLSYGGPNNCKNSFVKNWNSPSQYLRWNVHSSAAGNYYLYALMKPQNGIIIRVQVGSNKLDCMLSGDMLDKVALGQISIPQGSNALTISVPTGVFDMTIFSLELYPVAAREEIESKIANGSSRATWMSSSPLGMMYQWGQWGGNQTGKGSEWPACYANMDWSGFAQRIKDSGADFLVWSITYTEYYVAAPIRSIDKILPGRTSAVDYLDTLLTECQKRGVKVIFYYHAGHDPNPNSDWWNAFWTVPLTPNEVFARKETAMNKWLNIISEIGNRYGSKLAGWMFDDGGIFYPAPFDLVSAASRAGYPDRIISFNSAYVFGFAPKMTEYEDYYFGETTAWSGMMSWLTDDNGVYISGPFIGEHAFANFQTESGNWAYLNDASSARIGISPKHSISTTLSAEDFNTIAVNGKNMHSCAAYNFRMYEDGEQSQTSLERFKAAAALAHGISGSPKPIT